MGLNESHLDGVTMDKLLFGSNAEKKQVTAKETEELVELTGISEEELFGTEETGERVLYV